MHTSKLINQQNLFSSSNSLNYSKFPQIHSERSVIRKFFAIRVFLVVFKIQFCTYFTFQENDFTISLVHLLKTIKSILRPKQRYLVE